MTYRDAFLHCPRCRAALEESGSAHGCRACRGVWLGEARLDEMLRVMHDQHIPPRFEADPFATAALPCPECPAGLTPVLLEGVQVDRCPAQHGVWFDADELEAALRASADLSADSEVPNLRLGIWRQILSDLVGLLKTLGYGAIGVARQPLPHVGSVTRARHRKR